MLLGLVMVRIMPETNFSPAIEERQGLLKDFVCLFKLNLGFVKGGQTVFYTSDEDLTMHLAWRVL